MAEKYELGQGYVQIIPSAKGIEGKISAMLDPEAEKAGESAGKKVGAGMGTGIASVGKKIGKEIGIAIAAVGTATGKLIKDALAEYGEYEQLTGGVAKLFGDNADAVLKNASNAFKNAQLSANEYMQTVTSFSASLISSLGGDTEKAVAYADTAINDMADNANTFGTSMESIQNAYQGFAKQNYTMLDNLKLGYGGTKTEMERLVKDAEGLNSAFKATRDENGELALSFSDIVDAIHIVQENMGITGTTAKEAATTVQGSINTLKASWKNFLTGLGDPNADVKALTQNVISSAKQVIKNVMPIIKNVLKEIPTALKEIWDSLGQGKSTIAALGASFGGLKLGSTIWDLAKATGSFSPALGVAVGAVTAFGAAMAKLTYDMAMAKLESDELYQRQQFLTERTNELTDAVTASAQAYEQQASARQEIMNANMAEINNTQELWGELKNLLSTNDELSESDKARAQFILDQVNKALGTEYDLTDLLTEQKYELIDAIDQEIAARKDAVALQVLEEAYAESLRNLTDEETKLAEIETHRRTVEAEANAVRLEQMAMEEEARNNLLISSDAHWAQEKAIIDAKVKAYDEELAEIQASYDEQLNTVAGYVADKAMYEDASIAHAQGTFDLEKFMSAETRKAYVDDAKATAEGVAAANADATQSTLNALATQLSILTGKKWEFYDGGEGNILSYVDGIAAGTPLSVGEIKNMISQMNSQISDASGKFETSTGYIMSAIKNTIDNRTSSVVGSVAGLATAMNRAFDKVNLTASPSRLYIKSTEWITKGIEKGISEGEDGVVASMKSLATNMNDAYNSVIGDDATFSASKNINSITNETANFAGTITTAESASSKLDAIYTALSTFFPQMLEASEKDVVLDGGRLVGSLAPKINTELGKLQTKNNRGGICTA